MCNVKQCVHVKYKVTLILVDFPPKMSHTIFPMMQISNCQNCHSAFLRAHIVAFNTNAQVITLQFYSFIVKFVYKVAVA